MGKTLIVFAHPSHESFNFSLLEIVVATLRNKGYEFQVNDLYAMDFDPLMTTEELRRTSLPDQIIQEQAKISWAETLIFVFPIWWWGPPAILKGWLERVLCQDFAFRYDIGQNRLVGTLDGRTALIISTSSADPASYESAWQAESHTSFVRDILVMCGIRVTKLMNLPNVHAYSPPADLQSYQREVLECVQSL